jgi:hypothetical protein
MLPLPVNLYTVYVSIVSLYVVMVGDPVVVIDNPIVPVRFAPVNPDRPADVTLIAR